MSSRIDNSRIDLSLSTETEREDIFHLRHHVYAHELGQHPVNRERLLQDRCDEGNVYLVARVAGKIAGFISITLPGGPAYSLDKYLTREEMPFPVDDKTYEVRLLTVVSERRGRSLAVLLMYAAFRYVEVHGGTQIIAMGRRGIRAFYAKAGLELTGRLIPSGSVVYELMGASLVKLARSLARFGSLLARLRRWTDWLLCHLTPDRPDAATVCDRCRMEGVYLRDVGAISACLGRHALRIAVKDATGNGKTTAALCRALAR